ncbi:SCO family protein [Aliikangiella sp. IMCC44632]
MRFLLIVCVTSLLLGCNQNSNQEEKETSAVNHHKGQPFSQMLVFPKKNLISPFELTREDNSLFTQQEFKGYWNFIFMGFTHCPDVCPTTLADLRDIYAQIPVVNRAKMRIIFLSVDPQRDQIDYLKKYTQAFNPEFYGITGEKNQIDQLVKDLGGIYYINSEDPEFYTVDHTAKIFIVSPNAERYGIISSEAMHAKDKSALVAEINQLVSSNYP